MSGKKTYWMKSTKPNVLQNYLKTQASTVTNVGNSTVETNIESMDNSFGETSSNNGIPEVRKVPAATPSKINSTSAKQNPVIPTLKSLNPFAPEFEVSPFARDNPYYTADYEMGYPPFSTFCSFLQRESKLPAIP